MKLIQTDGTDNEKLRKIIATPNFNRCVMSSNDLSAIQVKCSVLDLSKWLMYYWYYSTLKQNYGENCTILYTVTDSLSEDLKTKDVYTDISEMKDECDFSD